MIMEGLSWLFQRQSYPAPASKTMQSVRFKISTLAGSIFRDSLACPPGAQIISLEKKPEKASPVKE